MKPPLTVRNSGQWSAGVSLEHRNRWLTRQPCHAGGDNTGPSISGLLIADRWFADDDETLVANPAQRRGQRVERRAETSRDDGTVLSSIHALRIAGPHVDAVLPSESTNHPGQKVGAGSTTIEKGHLPGWLIVGDHQAGHTAPRTEIEDRTHDVELLQRRHERASVLDHLLDRARTEKAQLLRTTEYVDQFVRDRG